MIANQDKLRKLFDQLLEEVLGLVDHAGKGRTPSGGIQASTANQIKNLIEKTTDQVNIITPKTITTYYKQGYSNSFSRIGLFAAVALVKIYKEELKPDDCKKHYAENKPSSPDYWNQYIDRAKNRPAPEPTPEYTSATAQWESQNQGITRDTLDVFPSPDYEGVFERPSTQEKLYDKICRHRLLAVDGIAGCGKKHLIKAMESMLKTRAKYNRIWWVPLRKKYDLEKLFDELPFESDDSVKGQSSKIRWFEDQLKSNRILVVFYEIDQGELDSFLPLIQGAIDKPGDCMYLVIRDNLSLLPEIPSVNSFTVPPYSKEEVVSFLESGNFALKEEDLIAIDENGGNWPFYLSILKEKAIDQPTLEKILKSSDLLNDDLSRWFRAWAMNLDDNAHKLLQVFFLYNRPISYTDIVSIARSLGLEQPDIQLEALKNNHFLVNDESGMLAISVMANLYAGSKPENGSGIPIHETISSLIRTKLPSEPSFNFSGEEWDLWLRVIEHDQEAGKFERASPLIDKIKRSLKRRNKYPILIDLLKKQIVKEQEKKNWFRYDLAHAYFVTGKYHECLAEISTCLDIAMEWYPQNTRDADGVSFFVKSVQLFSELCSAMGYNNNAIAIFSDALSLFDYAEMKWTNRCHTITVLSQFYERNRKASQSLKMNNNLLLSSYEHNTLAKAVISMRIALALRGKRKYRAAYRKLTQAQEWFAKANDQRGKAWCESILALDQLYHEKYPKAKQLIKQTIHVHAEGSLCNVDYQRWLQYLKYNYNVSELHPLIDSEISRTNPDVFYEGNTWKNKLVQKINHVTGWLRFRARIFDIESFIKPLRGNDIPLDSELNRSVEQMISYDPRKFLERIAKKQPEEIFLDSALNFQIAGCASNFECQQFIKRELITKHFTFLCDSSLAPDNIRIQYARILYLLNEYGQAKDLLDHVTGGNRGFDFVMLRADCLRRLKHFGEADSIYDTAMEAASRDTDKAMVRHKRAKLIIESKDTSNFGTALEWSKEALALYNSNEEFVKQVIDIIVYLQIELTPLERLQLEMQKLIAVYSLTIPRLESIVQNLADIPKRDLLKTALELYKT